MLKGKIPGGTLLEPVKNLFRRPFFPGNFPVISKGIHEGDKYP